MNNDIGWIEYLASNTQLLPVWPPSDCNFGLRLSRVDALPSYLRQ